MKRESITAIIPAHNESATIAGVIEPILSSKIIDEVIVVSDGSTDETVSVARDAGAKVIEIKENIGKGGAMMKGVEQTDSEIIAFFDADLLGLTSDHVELLARDVLSGERMMSCSLRDRGLVRTAITLFLPLISGERVLRREVIEGIPPRFLKGYMVEAAMNYHCRSRGWRYGAMVLKDLSFVKKYQKVGLLKAVLQYVHMFYQVGKAMIVVRLAHISGKF
jgi:polyisoprenyl-phosphate glycosyltransferase